MHDITYVDFNGANANHSFDIEVGQNSNNWYINLWKDNVSYCAELGLRLTNGSFFSFARSNCVATPRKSESNRRDEIWMEVKSDGSTAGCVHGSSAKAALAAGEKEKLYAPDKTGARAADAGKVKRDPQAEHRKRKRILLTEDDVRKYYSRLSPFLKEQIYQGLKKKLENEVRRIYKYSPADTASKGTADEFALRGMKSGEFYKRIVQGSSAELTIRGASESLAGAPGGASEQVKGDRKRKFFFELDAELIVYGRTEPDAMVRHGDKPVKLREDGTFTLRFAFPDGKIPLDFVAESSDGVEKREIRTSAERARTIRIPV
jgi:hypothetical protein